MRADLESKTAQPSNVKLSPQKHSALQPKVIIDQMDMHCQVFESIIGKPHMETVLMLYLQSLNKHNIAAQEDISKMLINEMIRNRSFDSLRRLCSHSLILESKSIACYLLSHSNIDVSITQIALDMLAKIKAHEVLPSFVKINQFLFMQLYNFSDHS